jgi:hypothetical protein
MSPVVNAMQERVHRIPKLVEVTTGKVSPTVLEKRGFLGAKVIFLSNSLLPLQPRGVAGL